MRTSRTVSATSTSIGTTPEISATPVREMACLIGTDVLADVSRRNADAANDVDSLSDAWIGIVTAREFIVGARDKRDVAGIDSLVASYPVAHIDARIGVRAHDLLKTYAKS
jgi:hypothetical protein